MEYGVKARLVSVSVEVAYTDSMKSTDITVDEQLHLHLAGTILSFAVSSQPSLFASLGNPNFLPKESIVTAITSDIVLS